MSWQCHLSNLPNVAVLRCELWIYNVNMATNSPNFEGTSTWFAAIRPALKTWLDVVEHFLDVSVSFCCARSAWSTSRWMQWSTWAVRPWTTTLKACYGRFLSPRGLEMCMWCACDVHVQIYGTRCKVKCCMMAWPSALHWLSYQLAVCPTEADGSQRKAITLRHIEHFRFSLQQSIRP